MKRSVNDYFSWLLCCVDCIVLFLKLAAPKRREAACCFVDAGGEAAPEMLSIFLAAIVAVTEVRTFV